MCPDMKIMKSYILRICRQSADDPESLIGVVEDPESEERTTFRNLAELWVILNSRKKDERREFTS